MSTRPFCRALSAAPFLPRPFCRALSAAPFLPRLIVTLALLCASPCLADPPAPPAARPLPWDAKTQGQFVTALRQDPQGRTVVATEGNGLWRWDPAAKQYQHFTTHDGLASDDVYALAADAKGRLWAGTLRGLSVYNGHAWKTYGPLEGVGGWRTFALAVCPTDGDVWIATEGGLTRYSLHTGAWTQLSRLDGLPSDALSCLAFRDNGDLYVGTQADGVASAARSDGYRHWRVTTGPAQMPHTNAGAGLPTSLINSLLVTHDGTVYAGTDTGLALSDDGGDTWRFLRGDDWEAMVKGLPGGPAPVKADTHGLSLLEDYVTCLAGDGHGHLLVGHRQRGMEAFSLDTKRRVFPGPKDTQPTDYVTALLPQPDGTCLVGGYGGGLAQTPLPGVTPTILASGVTPAPVPQAFPPLPAPAPPPTLAQLNAMLKVVSAVPPDPQEMQPKAVALDDDWATEGDWLGRYGRYWACLCAICAPYDYQWGAGWKSVNYVSQMGKAPSRDSLRYHVEWLYTADPRVLEMPPTYLDSRIKKGLTDGKSPRREAEQDDHGEAYSMTTGGLGVYETVAVPAGLYVLSLYEMNKDGHGGQRCWRDHRLSVRPHAAPALADISDFDGEPEWARGRVTQFWGGVWKRFLVRGPVALDVEVGANHSWDTVLQTVTLDLVDETPPPYFDTVAGWQESQTQVEMQWRSALTQNRHYAFHPATTAVEAAGRLLDSLGQLQYMNSKWWGVNGRCLYLPLMRWYAAQAARQGTRSDIAQWRRLGTCQYEAGLYPQWEDRLRRAGLTPARDIEQALKWDGSYDLRGQGSRVVTDYLIQHPKLNEQGRETPVALTALK